MEKYTYLKTIKSNKIFLYKDKQTDTLFEIVKSTKTTKRCMEEFDFVVAPKESISIGEIVWVVFEYRPERSLYTVFEQNRYLEEVYLRAIIYELLCITMVLYKNKLVNLSFNLENFKFSESGQLQVVDLGNLKSNKDNEVYVEDMENLLAFIYELARYNPKNHSEFCGSRKFRKFLTDIEEIRVSSKGIFKRLDLIKNHAFMSYKPHKRSVLIDLIDSYVEEDIHKNLKLSVQKQTPVQPEQDFNITMNKSEISANVAIQDEAAKAKPKNILPIVNSVFDKYLKTIEDEKPTYNTLFNIKKNIIELAAKNPEEFESLLANYLNYRSLDHNN